VSLRFTREGGAHAENNSPAAFLDTKHSATTSSQDEDKNPRLTISASLAQGALGTPGNTDPLLCASQDHTWGE
jgi:hypothetical protein